jgi:hypothetical protein
MLLEVVIDIVGHQIMAGLEIGLILLEGADHHIVEVEILLKSVNIQDAMEET